MQRISSRWTFYFKRVFPVVWFGFLGILCFVTLRSGAPFPFAIFPLIMAVFGYFLMKNLVFDLVDEVWDAGAELVVKNAGREERVRLTEIVNVSYTVMTSPQRVTLTLRQPASSGKKEVTFAAPAVWVPVAKSPIVEDLIWRIDAARRS